MPLALSYVSQYRDMVSDQATLRHVYPHEGRCQLSLSPPIVGLMRNSLSEAIRGWESPRHYPFSCSIVLLSKKTG